MCFLTLVIKAFRVSRKLKKYKMRKNEAREGQRPEKSQSKFGQFWGKFCPAWLGGYSKTSDQYNGMEKFCKKLTTNGTFENYIMKSIIGFLGGVCLTYAFFALFILQLNFSFIAATMLCSIFGMVLTLGLAYSYRVRCVVLMLLPQLFSKRGRQALTAYAFILVLTGPAKNSLHNMRMLSESLACGQAKLKKAIKSVIDILNEPIKALHRSLQLIVKKIKEIINKIKEMLIAIKKAILTILGILKAAYDWLNSVVSICSKKMGTPFERCSKVFDDAVIDCKAKLGPLFNWMCSVAYMVSAVCYTVKFLDYICALFEFVSDEIVSVVKRKFREFSYRVRNIFYVSVEYSHSLEMSTNQSKEVSDITAGIALEIRQRTSGLLTLFDWMSFAFSFFFLYMIFQTINYKRKFLTQDWYDNRFITDNIIMLDLKRTYMGKETILPLTFHERKKYISLTSWRLVATERRRLAKTAIFLTVATIKLSIHMLADYSLFWILNMIRYHGQFQTELDAPSNVEVQVSGAGMVADFFTTIINAFQPEGLEYDLDTTPCLPDPKPPDMGIYRHIVTLLIMTWILAITEPYGLRLRHYVMSYYYPQVARQRAVWLYNHILRSRGSFIKFARRQLRRKFNKGVAAYGTGIEKVGIMDRLRAVCPILRRICPGPESNYCLLCGVPSSPNNPLINCPTPDCPGKYCQPCYTTLNHICTLCKSPIEYGDLSDVSEEKDSSEEEYEIIQKKSSARKKKSTEIKGSVGENRGLLSESEESENERISERGEVYELGVINLDTTDSELSYTYQDQPRPLGDRPSYHPSVDVEAQKKVDRVTIDTFEEPVDEFYKDEKELLEMNLAERKKTSIVKSFSRFFFPSRTSEDTFRTRNFDAERQGTSTRDRTASESVLNTSNNPRIYMMTQIRDEKNNQITPWKSYSQPTQFPNFSMSDETFQARQRRNVKSAEIVYKNDRRIIDGKQSVSSWDLDNLGIDFSKQKYKGPLTLPVESIMEIQPETININKPINTADKVQSWLNARNFKEYSIDTIPIQADLGEKELDVRVREIKKSKQLGIFHRMKQVWYNITHTGNRYEVLSEGIINEEEESSEEESETDEQTSVVQTSTEQTSVVQTSIEQTSVVQTSIEQTSESDETEEKKENQSQELYSELSMEEETSKEETEDQQPSKSSKTESEDVSSIEEESTTIETKESSDTAQTEISSSFSTTESSETSVTVTSEMTTEITQPSQTTILSGTSPLISLSSDTSTVKKTERDSRLSYQGAEDSDWSTGSAENDDSQRNNQQDDDSQRNNQQEENQLLRQEPHSSRHSRPSFRSLEVKESKAQQMYKMFK